MFFLSVDFKEAKEFMKEDVARFISRHCLIHQARR